MTDLQIQLVSAARDYVTDLFINKVSKSVIYHNLEHTQGVVLACEEMADYYQLNPEDHTALAIAAWFHDTGFSSGDPNGHETVSSRLATTFLNQQKAEPVIIQKVISCIEATRMPQSPVSLIEQILCDADLFHLGTSEFKVKNELLLQELKELSHKNISKKKWRKMNISFLETHKYLTDFGRRKLQPLKEEHLAALKNKNSQENKKVKEKSEEIPITVAEEIKKEKEIKKKKEKENRTERGISTVFRIMASNQANLSHMADNKAHIMISVNSIILSVVIALVSKRLDEHPILAIPTITLIIVCVSTMIFSILATRPNITKGTFTRDDIQQKKTNLLFFGNFHSMTFPDYDWAMKELLEDRNYLYGSMIKDTYFLGVVLARKYRLLRISYNIFMYGLIVAMLIFGIALGYEALFVTTAVQAMPVVKP